VVKGMVEVLVGDFALGFAPLCDGGLGTPPALAHAEPKLGVTGTERTQLLGRAGQGGDFRWGEEREDADLDVHRKIGEGRRNVVVFLIHHLLVFLGSK